MKRSRPTAFALSLALVGTTSIVAPAQSLQTPPAESTASAPHGVDRYDVGAAAANVLWVPAKVATCGISAGAGALAFVITLGAASAWTQSAFEEGCVRNWLLTGDDFRPGPTPGYADARQ